MKTKLFIILIAFCGFAKGQTPNWQWAKCVGGTSDDIVFSASTDASGNVYVAGIFSSSTIIFGSTTLTNTNTGSPDIFLAKYDASGNVLWAKSAGGTGSDRQSSITIDTLGNVYMLGWFRGSTLTFGSTTLTNADSTGNTSDIFLAKYDTNGNVLWAKSAGGISIDEAYSVSVQLISGGNIYVTGIFFSSSITFGSTTLTNAGGADIFLVQYDANGNILWAKSDGGTNFDYAQSASTDAFGNVYVAGYFSSSTITFGSTTLTNAGSNIGDIFLAKYDAYGNVLWAKSAGGIYFDSAYSLATDASGNVYVAGIFSSSTITFGSTTLINAGSNTGDIFLVKYDDSGNVLWAKSASGIYIDYAFSLTTDAFGNVYVAGYFLSSTIIFGSTTLANTGGLDIFLAEYAPNGNVLWAKSTGGTNYDYAYSISTDASGNVYVAGGFQSSTITFGSTTLTNAGSNTVDIFLAKLNGVSGVYEWSDKESISVYPNPFSTQIILQTYNLLHNATLTVKNSFGQTVKQIKNISGHTFTLQRDNLPCGIYFIRLTQDNKVFTTEKLIITD